ncbi:hypothetical protein PFNF54_05065 [Plasmodium falciparum NF54]|uniref:Uncharacterized protein n=1 Tax=Plasmodium falciparum (isolate NF54) TaxID=5843 RepID=W7K039_PLAFO|nr:hypothetical protein PFNF54_05065 [Plasmodium falciparum NF54]
MELLLYDIKFYHNSSMIEENALLYVFNINENTMVEKIKKKNQLCELILKTVNKNKMSFSCSILKQGKDLELICNKIIKRILMVKYIKYFESKSLMILDNAINFFLYEKILDLRNVPYDKIGDGIISLYIQNTCSVGIIDFSNRSMSIQNLNEYMDFAKITHCNKLYLSNNPLFSKLSYDIVKKDIDGVITHLKNMKLTELYLDFIDLSNVCGEYIICNIIQKTEISFLSLMNCGLTHDNITNIINNIKENENEYKSSNIHYLNVEFNKLIYYDVVSLIKILSKLNKLFKKIYIYGNLIQTDIFDISFEFKRNLSIIEVKKYCKHVPNVFNLNNIKEVKDYFYCAFLSTTEYIDDNVNDEHKIFSNGNKNLEKESINFYKNENNYIKNIDNIENNGIKDSNLKLITKENEGRSFLHPEHIRQKNLEGYNEEYVNVSFLNDLIKVPNEDIRLRQKDFFMKKYDLLHKEGEAKKRNNYEYINQTNEYYITNNVEEKMPNTGIHNGKFFHDNNMLQYDDDMKKWTNESRYLYFIEKEKEKDDNEKTTKFKNISFNNSLIVDKYEKNVYKHVLRDETKIENLILDVLNRSMSYEIRLYDYNISREDIQCVFKLCKDKIVKNMNLNYCYMCNDDLSYFNSLKEYPYGIKVYKLSLCNNLFNSNMNLQGFLNFLSNFIIYFKINLSNMSIGKNPLIHELLLYLINNTRCKIIMLDNCNLENPFLINVNKNIDQLNENNYLTLLSLRYNYFSSVKELIKFVNNLISKCKSLKTIRIYTSNFSEDDMKLIEKNIIKKDVLSFISTYALIPSSKKLKRKVLKLNKYKINKDVEYNTELTEREKKLIEQFFDRQNTKTDKEEKKDDLNTLNRYNLNDIKNRNIKYKFKNNKI